MDKTEFMWCTTARRQHHLPTTSITVGSILVTPSTSVRDLGIYIDADLVMRTHVQSTVSRCFATLRQLRSIRRSVPTSTRQTQAKATAENSDQAKFEQIEEAARFLLSKTTEDHARTELQRELS